MQQPHFYNRAQAVTETKEGLGKPDWQRNEREQGKPDYPRNLELKDRDEEKNQ